MFRVQVIQEHRCLLQLCRCAGETNLYMHLRGKNKTMNDVIKVTVVLNKTGESSAITSAINYHYQHLSLQLSINSSAPLCRSSSVNTLHLLGYFSSSLFVVIISNSQPIYKRLTGIHFLPY